MKMARSDSFLITILALAVSKAVLTRVLGLGATDIPMGIALEIAIPAVILCAVDLLPRRRRPLITFGAYLAVGVIMYLNLLYVRAFDQVIDPSTLKVAGQVGEVFDMVAKLVHPIDLLYVIDIPLVGLWASDLQSFENPRPSRRRWVAMVGGLALVLAIIQVNIVVRIPSATDSIAVAKHRGLGAYQVASFVRAEAAAQPAEKIEPTPQEAELSPGAIVQGRIDALRPAVTSARAGGLVPGAYTGKHVILIQVEALQSLAYGSYFDSQEITPNLNKMVEDSWICTNAFSQSGVGNTSDSEFTVNTSLLQPHGKAAIIEYADREIPAMPRLLSDKGYRSITLHGNDVAFWNRKELYPALGFDKYYDRQEIGNDDTLYRGVSDEAFFSAAQDIITDELGRGKPLYINLVTMSSHAPFDHVPFERCPVQVPQELHGNRAADWVSAISYADMALGQFLDWLRETGLYDESIVVVYGDHQAIKELNLFGADKQIVEGLLGRQYTIVDRQKVSLIVHLPGQTAGGVVEHPVGLADVAPTVADLVGVDMSQTPHLGRSMFALPADPLVITRGHFPAGAFVNGRVAFLPGLGFDDGSALVVENGAAAKPTNVEQRDYERISAMSELAEQWVYSLPKRPDAGRIEDAVIPRGAQRAYAE